MSKKKSDVAENPVKEVLQNMVVVAPEVNISDEQKNLLEVIAGSKDDDVKIFEIMQGLTVEEMTAMFFDRDALKEPPYKVYQLNSKGYRYYYRYNDEGEPEFYPSVTTILSKTLPKQASLINWIASKGIEESERYKAERSSYGTFMHGAFEELIISRSYDLDGLKERLKKYIEVNRLPEDFIYYADDLKKDVLAFAQFVIDYDVRPLAVEISLVHPYYNYAGMIDLPCTMREKLGGDDRINAIIDFKSGRKGFYEEHEIQLGMYRDMWNVNFPDTQITRIFNFAPKDWRKEPTYTLKEQTGSPNLAKIPCLLELASIEDGKKENIFTSCNGVVSLDEVADLTGNITSLTLAELVKTKAPKPENPDEDAQVADEVKEDAKKEVEKAKIVKRSKQKNEKPQNKTVEAKKTTKRSTARKEVKKSNSGQKTVKKAGKINLLEDNIEI